MLREGSSARNALDLLPLVDDITWPRCCFASDDRDCAMLLSDGHMDATLRKVVAAGLDPVRAIQMSTITTATYWRLDNVGAIAPGYWANIVALDDLTTFNVASAFYRGVRVANQGAAEFDVKTCLLYTSDAADDGSSVDLGGPRIIKKKIQQKKKKNT